MNVVEAACFLDTQNVLSSINIDLLLIKLTYYGVHGREHEWFSNYLHGRSQAVYIVMAPCPLFET